MSQTSSHNHQDHPPLTGLGRDEAHDGASIHLSGHLQQVAISLVFAATPDLLCRICQSNIIINAAHLMAAQAFVATASRLTGPGLDRAAFTRMAGEAFDKAVRSIDATSAAGVPVPDHLSAFARANTAERVQ